MDVLECAKELRDEAQELLDREELWAPFASRGAIHVVGSTYLDLLVFPDLDVYFEVREGELEAFAEASQALILADDVTTVELEKELHLRYPAMVPEGIFLQYRIKNEKRLWKVDIWALADTELLEQKMAESARFKEKMSLEQRELILQTKHRLAAPFGRSPVGSSYLVYLAVLEEGIGTVDGVIDYIRAQGGNVDTLK